MDKEELRKAQQASRTAFLRQEAQRRERAAAKVLQEKVSEIEQGVGLSSLVEAEFLHQRAEEVNAAGGLLRAAHGRQKLVEEALPDLEAQAQLRTGRNGVEAVVDESLRAKGFVEDDVQPVGGIPLPQDGFVSMADAVVQARVEQKEYTTQKSMEELRNERVTAVQNRQEQLQAQRRSLPIYRVRHELLDIIRRNQVIVIVGETGCGKTTQVLQYLYEEGLHMSRHSAPEGVTEGTRKTPVADAVEEEELRLICSQPRRIAAVSVAERVAQEMGTRCGSVVGYKVRFDDKSSPSTRVLYVTDGMMLKEFTNDPDLRTVAAIMVDEAHERSLNTDVLLGLLRDVVRRNSHIKVIVASATINADKFSNFFNKAPIYTISGRTFPVEVFYASEPIADYVFESAQTVFGLHAAKPLPGDILVFLPGQDAIESCAEMLSQQMKDAGEQMRPLLVLPIYSSLPPKEQARIYETTPSGTRKVVLATNIAETSITIDGVVYVVDCGLCKQNYYNPRAMVEELHVVPTSQASAIQRTGRAGRTQIGECFRLYTAYTFKNELPPETVPEILRSSMSAVVLQLKALGINNLLHFDFVDAPSTASLERALDHLYLLGAMKPDGRLTVSGRRMAEFPMDPSLSKCLIKACALGCGRHMAMAVAMLSLDSIFVSARDPSERKNIRSAMDRLFSFGNGDIAGYVRILEEWLRAGSSAADFCRSHCINPRSMLRARDVFDQILKIYDRTGLDLKEVAAPKDDGEPSTVSAQMVNVEALTMALLSGFFFNVSKLQEDKRTYRIIRPMATGDLHRPQKPLLDGADDIPIAELHPTSFLFNAGMMRSRLGGTAERITEADASIPAVLRERPPLVVFTQLRHTKRRYMMHVSAVFSPEWVLEAAPVNYFQKEELDTGLRKRPRN